MKKLEDVIAGYEISDARAAFYYLSRYLKQADYFEIYEKDYFEDDFQSAPSEVAKSLTFALIEFIEVSAGKKAVEFSEEEYVYWMNVIDLVENQLDPEPSKEVKDSAETAINELFLPKIGKN